MKKGYIEINNNNYYEKIINNEIFLHTVNDICVAWTQDGFIFTRKFANINDIKIWGESLNIKFIYREV